jgi:hypothetical protein
MDSFSEDDDNSNHSAVIDREVALAMETVRRQQEQKNNHAHSEDSSMEGGSRESPLRTTSGCTTASSSSCSIQPKRRGSHRPPPPVTIPPGLQFNVLKKRERNSTSSSAITPIAPPPQPTKSKMKLQQQIAQAVQSAQVDKNLARFNESFRFADGRGGIFPIPDDSANKSLIQQSHDQSHPGDDQPSSCSIIPQDITFQISKNEERVADGGYTSDNSIELFPAKSTSNKTTKDVARFATDFNEEVEKSIFREDKLESSAPKFQSSFVSLTDTTVDFEHNIPVSKSSSKRTNRKEDSKESRNRGSKDEPTSKSTKTSSKDRSEKVPKSPTKKSSSSKDRLEKEPKSPTKKGSKDRTEKEPKSPKSPSKKSSSSKDRAEKESESPRKSTRSSKDESTKEPKSPKKSSSRGRTEKTDSPKKSSSKDRDEKDSKSPKRKSASKDKNNDSVEEDVDSPRKIKDRGEKESKSSSTKKSSSRSDDVKEPKSPKKSSKDVGDKELSRKSASKDKNNKDPDSPRKSSSKKRSSDGSKSPKKRETFDGSKSPNKRETKESSKNHSEQRSSPAEESPCENVADTSAGNKSKEQILANVKEASFRINAIQDKTTRDSEVDCDLLASLTSGSFWDVVDDVKKLPATTKKQASTENSIEDERQISTANEESLKHKEDISEYAASNKPRKQQAQSQSAKNNGNALKLEDIYMFKQDDDSSERSEAIECPVQETSLKEAIWIKLENETTKDANDIDNKKALEKKFIALKNKFSDSDSSDSDDSDSSDNSSTFVREAAKQCAKHHEELSQLSKRACQVESIEADQSQQSTIIGAAMTNMDSEAENMLQSSQKDHVDPLVVVEALAKGIGGESKTVLHEIESESDSSESCTGDDGGESRVDQFMSSYEEQRRELTIRRSPNRIQSKSLANSSSIEERKKFLAGLSSATSSIPPFSPTKEIDSPTKKKNNATTSRFQRLQQLAKQNSTLKATSTEKSSKITALLPCPTSPSTPRKAGSKFEELRQKAMGANIDSKPVNNGGNSPLRVQPVANFMELRQKVQGISQKESCKSDEVVLINENNRKSLPPMANRKLDKSSDPDCISVSLQNATTVNDRKSSLFLQSSNQVSSAGIQRAQEAKSSNFANLRKIAMLAPEASAQNGTKQNEARKNTVSASADAARPAAPQISVEDRLASSKYSLKCNPETSSTSSQRAQEARSSNFAELRKQAMLVAKEVNQDQDTTPNTENDAGGAVSASKGWRGSVARQPSESLQNVTSLKDRMKFLEKKTSVEQTKDVNQRCDEQVLKTAADKQTEVQGRVNGVSGPTSMNGRVGNRFQDQGTSLGVSSNFGKNTFPRTPQANSKIGIAATTTTANQTGQDSKLKNLSVPDKDEHGRPLSEFARRMMERQRKQIGIPSE